MRSVRLVLLLVTVMTGTMSLGTLPFAPDASAAPPVPAISLSVLGGPPTSPLTVTGRGFGSAEPVDLYVGTRRVATGTSTAAGTLGATPVVVPAATPPGTAPVVATGRTSHLTAQGRFVVKSDWAQTGFGATRQGWNPFENVLNKSNAAAVSQSWRYYVQDTIPQGFVVSNGYVVWSSYSGLTGIAESGGPRPGGLAGWTDTGLSGGGQPVAGGGLVYVVSGATGSNFVVAVDIYTGHQRWAAPLGSTAPAYLTLAGTSLYATTGGGALLKLVAATGAPVWSAPTGCGSSAVVGADLLYLRCADQSVEARSVATGAARWSRSFNPYAYPLTPGFMLGGTTLLVAQYGGLAAVDAATGSLRWTSVISAGASTSTTVYGDTGTGIAALDISTGATKWRSTVSGSPVVANGVLYASNGLVVNVLDAGTGTVLGTPISASDPVYGIVSLAVSSGAVYSTIIDRDFDGKYYGSELVKYAPPPEPGPFVTVDDKAAASGPNHLTYSAGWKSGTNTADYLGTDSYASTRGATASFTFTGTGFRLWFSAADHHGIVSVTADRKTATGSVRTSFGVDEYSPVRRDGVSAATSPLLPLGTYTVTVTASGARNAASTGTTVSLDRIDFGRL